MPVWTDVFFVTVESGIINAGVTVDAESKNITVSVSADFTVEFVYWIGYPKATSPFTVAWSRGGGSISQGQSPSNPRFSPVQPNLTKVVSGQTVPVGPLEEQDATLVATAPATATPQDQTTQGEIRLVQPP